jgi:hypothetical protein
MSRRPQDLISKLADAGEEAIQKVTDIPGAARLTQSVNATKERLDELTKKMRGIDAMEKRIAKLERRLDDLQGKQKTASTRAIAKTTTGSSRKKTTGSSSKKTSGSSSRTKKT